MPDDHTIERVAALNGVSVEYVRRTLRAAVTAHETTVDMVKQLRVNPPEHVPRYKKDDTRHWVRRNRHPRNI